MESTAPGTARAALLRELAEKIRFNANSREEIAHGFEIIASCMEPCTDCGHEDAPDTGTDQGMGGTD